MIDLFFLTNFFLLTGIVGGFIVIILLTISARRFLKGDVKTVFEQILCGCLFLYSFLVANYLMYLFLLRGTFLEIFGGLFLYIAFVYFIFAAVNLHEISKTLGFASEKVSRKLKRILES